MWLDEYCFRSRGYGIHSPMLYRIVRGAMMPRHIIGTDYTLYDTLRTHHHIGKRTAIRLQNLYTIEGHSEWRIDELAGAQGLTILTPSCTAEKAREIVGTLKEGTVCVITPLGDCKRRRLCRRMVADHTSMSAEKPQMMLFFARPDLRKQHIKI
ncbi:MAG: hypothetical protein J6U53_01730 [Tidjanibacter sp.]|nr:hypothetical protein [Tidjanibacter sp.]